MKLHLIVIYILALGAIFCDSGFSMPSNQCGSFYLVNPYSQIEDVFQVFELAKGPAAKDSLFVVQFSQIILKWEGSLEKYTHGHHTLAWSLEQLLSHPENYKLLRPLYHILVERFMAGNYHILTNFDFQSLIVNFSKIPDFADETTRLTGAALRISAKKKIKFNHFFTNIYKNIKDVEVKQNIVDHFLMTLFSKDREIIHFAYNNKLRQLRKIPMALGSREVLERLSVRTGSINYKEWELFRWMDDSKSISSSGFGRAFKIVADQTDAIHFEIGNLIKDGPAFKHAVQKIAQMVKEQGDEYVLDYLADIYEMKGKKGVRPHLNSGQISITNLEFFWIVTNREYLSKTHFYRNYKEISKEEITQLIANLEI